MSKLLILFMFAVATCLAACSGQAGGYMAASSISKDGFARNAQELQQLDGQTVKLWGFIDHGNMYGDEEVKAILGDWWSGPGPDAATWRFNMKAKAGDEAGHSFPVYVPNDPGRDELLRRFAADAQAQRPTKVFLTGELVTFDAPTNTTALTGLTVEVQASSDIIIED